VDYSLTRLTMKKEINLVWRNESSRLLDALDARSGHALLETGAEDGARRVHGAALVSAGRLAVLATATVDGVDDGDKLLLIGANLELDLTVAKRVQGEILTRTDAFAGVKLRETRKHTRWTRTRSVSRRECGSQYDATTH